MSIAVASPLIEIYQQDNGDFVVYFTFVDKAKVYNVIISIVCLFMNIIGPITHKVLQKNYYIPQIRGMEFVYTICCVIRPTISKNIHTMRKSHLTPQIFEWLY